MLLNLHLDTRASLVSHSLKSSLKLLLEQSQHSQVNWLICWKFPCVYLPPGIAEVASLRQRSRSFIHLAARWRSGTDLRMFMGATPSQVLVLGLKRSTEFRQLVPSFPPATYSMPSSTATPALLRRLSMLAMAVQALLCSGQTPRRRKYRWGGVRLVLTRVAWVYPQRDRGQADKRDVKWTAYCCCCCLPGGRIFPRWPGVKSCHNLPPHINYHLLEGKAESTDNGRGIRWKYHHSFQIILKLSHTFLSGISNLISIQ